MIRRALGVLLVLWMGSVAAAAPDLLLRVERKTPHDLAELRRAGFAVVLETRFGLLIRGNEADAAALRSRGFEPRRLEGSVSTGTFVLLGLRPDSDLEAIRSVGTTLFSEENLVFLRVDAGVSLEPLHDARAFARRISLEPVDPPRPESAPAAATDGTPDPIVQKIVASVSNASIQAIWQDLATNSPTGTRYSTTQGCRDAAAYCLAAYSSYGIPAAYQNWNAGHAPNVVATLTGAIRPEDVYIVEGHLDDLPSSGPAPGADDNASGTVNVLESAKRMSCWAFRNTVKYLNVTGEELGLLGSEYYADDAALRGESIRGVINMDMPGWAGDGLPSVENLDLDYNTPSQWLAQRFVDAAATYGTGLAVNAIYCPSLTASDHYPFWQKGWSAICGITDNEGYCGQAGNYPYYHTSNDTIANCGNPAFFYSVVRTSIATLAELAQPFKIAFDRPTYACGTSLKVVLGDRDLDTNPAAPETVAVRVWSTSEPAGEIVTLTERGPHSMLFEATVPTSAGAPVPGDGILAMAAGDALEAEYTDALDCDGAANVVYRAQAGTDCTGPVISSVAESDVTDVSAKIRWTTDEAADSVVIWGPVKPPTQSSSNGSAVTAHEIPLSGLQPCTVYYYEVRSTDPAGNVASDANGGQWFHFETLGNFGAGLQPCHEGKIALDKSVVGCTDGLPVQLVDLDLNLSSTTIDAVTVGVTSSTEIQPEILTLVETGANTSTFRGTLPTAAGTAAADGVLQVAGGDLVTATYRDRDDGTGVPATAFATGDVDCGGPAITDIRVTDVGDDSAVVRWTTSEPADSRVDWGVTSALGSVATNATLASAHAITVGPIAECSRAYFRITSTDAYGNTASRDVAGSPFEWSAFRIPGFWRDEFEGTATWTLEGEWQIGSPQAKGTSPGDPAAAYAGAKVLGQDLTGLGAHPGDYENSTNQRAYSAVINASSLVHGQLKFRRWLNVGGGSASSVVEIRKNGTWFTVWANTIAGISDAAWGLQTVDISTYADGNASMQIAFRQNGGLVSGGTRAGWNVDRVIVRSADQPEFDACGGCGGAPSFGGVGSAADVSGCADTGVRLDWGAAPSWGTGHAGSYAVYRSADPSFVPAPANRIAAGVAGTTYTDASAPNATPLHYIVRAENDETCSTGPANGGVTDLNLVRRSARDDTSQPAPGDVGGSLRVDPINQAHVRLTWSAAPAAAAYRVYRATEPGGPFALLAEPVGTMWEDRDDLGTLTSRHYRVRAIDACGNEGP